MNKNQKQRDIKWRLFAFPVAWREGVEERFIMVCGRKGDKA